jgi:hypothetical protein
MQRTNYRANTQGSLKKSEMGRMQGIDIEDVYLILRNGCNEANAVFLASLNSK